MIIIKNPLSCLAKVSLSISFLSENCSIVVVSESDLIMSALPNERRGISCDFCWNVKYILIKALIAGSTKYK